MIIFTNRHFLLCQKMKLSMVIFVFSMWTNHPSVALHDDKCKLLRESKTGISIFARKNIDKYILITTDGYIFQFPIQNLNLESKPMTLTLIGRGKEIIKEYKSLSRDIRYSSDKNDPIVHRLFFDNAKEWLVYFNTYYKDRVWNKTCYQIYALDSDGKTLDNEICLCDPGEKDEKKVWICGKEAESLFLSHGDYLTTGPNSRRTLEIKHYKKENSLCIYQYLQLPGARETQYKMLGAEPRTINCWAIKNETLTSGPPDAGLYWEKDPSGAETSMKMLLIWNSNAIYGSHSRSEEGIVRLGKAASDDWAKGKHMTEEQEVRMSQFIDCRRDDGDDVTTNEVNDLTTTNGSFFHNHHLEIICVVLVALIVLVFFRSSCCSNKTMFNYDKKGEKRRRKKKKLSEKGRKHLQQPSSVVPASTTTTISQLQGASYLSNNAASAASTVPSSNVSSLVKNQSQKRKTTKKKTRKRQSPIEKLHSLITSKLNTLRSMVTASVAKSRAAARKREQ